MLDKQVNMYSLDTGHFYSRYERYLHNMNCKYRQERKYLKNKIAFFDDVMKLYGYTQSDLRYIKNGDFDKVQIVPFTSDIIREYFLWHNLIAHKRKKAGESKNLLLSCLHHKVEKNIDIQNRNQDGRKRHLAIRQLREQDIHDTNIISVFESSLTRMMGIQQDELTEGLMVIQVYYFDLFKDLCLFGFEYKGEKYKYFTSSAGQIRKKKGVFIKCSLWDEYEKTIMCGLTIEKINHKGGNNVNKHLAYMALVNSATDEWHNFDIDKAIVIDDFETNVHGTYDLIDDVDYTVNRLSGDVPIPHTDGIGMMLPSVYDHNTMVRAPWIKGLLGIFDFRKFIIDNECSPIVCDIYGKEYDVIKDDIQIIFFKSQFKMYKYYSSWDEYKNCFRRYNCQAGVCNTEEDRIKNAKINYQMLQTLTSITSDEIDLIAKKSVDKISNICTSQQTMLDILGVTPYNNHMTPFQKAIKIYPELLKDTYSKDIIRDVKNSLLKKYRSGKLEVNGKYTFLMPDFYAVCQYVFQHIEEPAGLLDDHEVYCKLFKADKLDCLRSPHLYKEHAVRKNVAYGQDKSVQLSKWFQTNALYTSSHDLISKILQFDVDGDKSLVIADQQFIAIVEKNMEGIVPLYYNMRKADPTVLTNESIYHGLNVAFTHGNIGIYSNNISKIWNSDIFVNGTKEEKSEALECVKLLCMENNFSIDSAKTLYLPQRPKWFKQTVAKYTHCKLPAFFKFAKDKTEDQVEKPNDSFVNQLFVRIPNYSINTRGLHLGNLDYQKMMNNVNVKRRTDVIDLYNKLNQEYRYKINMKDEYIDNLRYVACSLRDEFSSLGVDEVELTDILVQYLYGNNKRSKQLLWFCYGYNIVSNLEKNVKLHNTRLVQCVDCGEWFEVDYKNTRSCRCDICLSEYRTEQARLRQQKRRAAQK